jgi:hypothetical protein
MKEHGYLGIKYPVINMIIEQSLKDYIDLWAHNAHLYKKVHQDKFRALRMGDTIGWPPIEFECIKGSYKLIDGHHRLYIAIKRGDPIIKAFISKLVEK